jgi:RNA polymerase-binding transcription factor DksA
VNDPSSNVPIEGALDLDAIATDLDAVDAALARLEDGTYFTDEVTGLPLDPAVLAERPTARHA